MASKAFKAIKAGMEDAIAHLSGEGGRGRLRRVRVPEVDVGTVRAKLRLSQQEFAAAFGVSLGTVRNWEQGRRRPDGPARVLLVVINKAPKTVMDVLGVGRKAAA